MKKMIFDLLTSPMTISDNYFIDFAVITIIGFIAYKIAFKVVGDIGVRGEVGSLFHWIIRFLIFSFLCFLCSIFIRIGLFVIEHKVLVLCSFCFILLCFVVAKFLVWPRVNSLRKE